VAASYVRRWDGRFRASAIRAFAHGLVMREEWGEDERLAVAAHYVETVTENIDAFLEGKPHVRHLAIENAAEDFAALVDWIGGRGDVAAGAREFAARHNASPGRR
jgi:hypothetical protein